MHERTTRAAWNGGVAGVALASACLLTSRPAPAGESSGQQEQHAAASFQLEWVSPASCPTKASIEHEVQRMLHAPIGLKRTRRLRARAVAHGPDDQGRWRLQLATYDDHHEGHREVTATSCEALAKTVSLVIGMMLTSPAVAPAEDQPSPLRAIAPDQGWRDHNTAEPSPRAFAPFVEFGTSAAALLLPRTSLGLRLATGAAWHAFSPNRHLRLSRNVSVRLAATYAHLSASDQRRRNSPVARPKAFEGGIESCAN